MREPSIRTSRLAIAGGLAAAIAVGGAGFFLGRTTSPRTQAPPAARPASPAPAPRVDAAPRTLGRADIIALANQAADALTAGAPMPAAVTRAAGRRFDIALPFGCDGPAVAGSTAPMRWRYDAEGETLRVHAAPIRWPAADWRLSPDAAGGTGAYRGFWISRPWSSLDRCPTARGQAMAVDGQPVTLPGQTLALAEKLPADAREDDRPYETVKRLAPDLLSASQGFRLRLTGRVEPLPGGAPVRCVQPAGIEQRPICLVAASFDEVRIENPVTGEALGTWTSRPEPRQPG